MFSYLLAISIKLFLNDASLLFDKFLFYLPGEVRNNFQSTNHICVTSKANVLIYFGQNLEFTHHSQCPLDAFTVIWEICDMKTGVPY